MSDQDQRDTSAATDDTITVNRSTFDLLAGWEVACSKCDWLSGFIQWRQSADEIADSHRVSAAHHV